MCFQLVIFFSFGNLLSKSALSSNFSSPGLFITKMVSFVPVKHYLRSCTYVRTWLVIAICACVADVNWWPERRGHVFFEWHQTYVKSNCSNRVPNSEYCATQELFSSCSW